MLQLFVDIENQREGENGGEECRFTCDKWRAEVRKRRMKKRKRKRKRKRRMLGLLFRVFQGLRGECSSM